MFLTPLFHARNYSMPTAEDVEFLTREESENSLSMYLDTHRKLNLNDLRTKAKSLFNEALRNSHLELSRQHKERLNEQYEAVSYDKDVENDLLNRLALTVFFKGGELLAVRPEETSFDFSNSPVLAQLR